MRSWGGRLAELAQSRPDEPAVIWSPAEGPETVVTRRQLDEQANAFAHVLAEAGAGPGTFVVNGLANCPEHVVVSFATWKAGACALPVKSSLPERERDEIMVLADPAVVVAEWSQVPAGRLMARAQVLSAPAARCL